jgi:hypothetical protein
MEVTVTDDDRRFAAEVHRLFSAKPHSQHIASRFALAHLAALVRGREFRSVLEFGAGIGTMTYLLLSRLPTATVECTERNETCLAALSVNIPESLRGRLIVHSNGTVPNRAFDLIIVDGKANLNGCLKPGTVCFIEGDRTQARAQIGAFFVHYRPGWRDITWRMTRLRFPVPNFGKGCWIGRVERVAGSRASEE